MFGSIIISTLGALATQLPTFIVLVVGIVLALTNRDRLGRTATFALVGLVLLVVDLVAGTAISMSAPFLYSNLGWSASQVGIVFGGIGLIRSLLGAAGFGCLLAAIFGRR